MNADARRWTNPWTGWPGRRVLGLALLVIAVVGGHGVARAAGAGSEGRHVLFVEVQPPHARNRDALRKLLRQEGHEPFTERDNEIALVMTEAQIAGLFGARIRYRAVEGSAAPGARRVPYLEGARIAERFGGLVRGIRLDPQR